MNEGFQGTVDGVDLIDIVQFNALSRATAALKVTTGDKEGMIFFMDGSVVHAMCGQESGESAFFTILGFNGGSLQNIRGVEPPIISIEKSVEGLLFEAALQNDEKLEAERISSDDTKTTADSVPHNLDDEQLLTAELEDIVSEAEQEFETNPVTDANQYEQINVEIAEDEPTTSTEDLGMTEIQSLLAEFTNITVSILLVWLVGTVFYWTVSPEQTLTRK